MPPPPSHSSKFKIPGKEDPNNLQSKMVHMLILKHTKDQSIKYQELSNHKKYLRSLLYDLLNTKMKLDQVIKNVHKTIRFQQSRSKWAKKRSEPLIR